MSNTAETELIQTEQIDVATLKENSTLGNGVPLAIQLKGFNRMDRIGRGKEQVLNGQRGSSTSRPISNGAVMVMSDLAKQTSLSANSSALTLNLPDSRGIATHGDEIYLGSVDRVYHIDAGNGTKSILEHPWFAFIHSLQLTENGEKILVTSPGFDRIIELDTATGAPSWEWVAWDHGYDHSVASGKKIVTRPADSGLDNAVLISSPKDYPGGLGLPPADRAAFPNSATYFLDNKSILATLFHGGLIKIDRKTGNVDLVLSDLSHPHGILKYQSGYIVTDTGHGAFLVLDKNLKVAKRVSFINLPGKAKEAQSAEWLQNVAPLNNGLLVAIDSNRASFYILDLDNKLKRRISYDPNWVVQEVRPLSPQLTNGLLAMSPSI